VATVITAAPKLDKAKYSTGDTITVTIPGATATSSVDGTQHLALTLTSADGTSQVFNADVPVTTVRKLAVKITAVSLDGKAGAVAADGQSATVTAA
jgi:hypothetical protein